MSLIPRVVYIFSEKGTIWKTLIHQDKIDNFNVLTKIDDQINVSESFQWNNFIIFSGNKGVYQLNKQSNIPERPGDSVSLRVSACLLLFQIPDTDALHYLGSDLIAVGASNSLLIYNLTDKRLIKDIKLDVHRVISIISNDKYIVLYVETSEGGRLFKMNRINYTFEVIIGMDAIIFDQTLVYLTNKAMYIIMPGKGKKEVKEKYFTLIPLRNSFLAIGAIGTDKYIDVYNEKGTKSNRISTEDWITVAKALPTELNTYILLCENNIYMLNSKKSLIYQYSADEKDELPVTFEIAEIDPVEFDKMVKYLSKHMRLVKQLVNIVTRFL